MDKLNDDELLMILKLMTINERASLRLVSSRYKRLIDSIKFKELIVSQNLKPISGQFEDGDCYDLDKCVCVTDLNKFLNCESILDSMKYIKKLKLIGEPNYERFVKIKFGFRQLTYFEAYRVLFSNPTIVNNSPNIHTLILKDTFMNYDKWRKLKDIYMNNDNSRKLDMVYDIFKIPQAIIYNGFEYLKLNIKHLRLISPNLLDIYFFEYLVENNILKQIEKIDGINLEDLETLAFIVDNFKSLKKVNCLIGNDLKNFDSLINKRQLDQIASKLTHLNLTVNIWGCLLIDQSVSIVYNFLSKYRQLIRVQRSEVYLILNEQFSVLIDEINKNEDLFGEFFNLIKNLEFKIKDVDSNVIKRFVNCESVNFYFYDKNPPCHIEMKKILQSLSITTSFCTTNSCFEIRFSNEILDLIPIYCKDIESLYLDIYSKINNFNFLFKLARLKRLAISLRYPLIGQSTFIELISNLRQLGMLDICFVRSANMTTDQLSAFKKLINSLNEINTNAFSFNIQIYTSKKGDRQVVRYFYLRGFFHLFAFKDKFFKENCEKLCKADEHFEKRKEINSHLHFN